jgi:hypothetical protein
MDWEGVARRLKVAERYVAESGRLVARARQAVEGAMAQGCDSAPAQATLRRLERLQVAHLRERDRLRAALKRVMH